MKRELKGIGERRRAQRMIEREPTTRECKFGAVAHMGSFVGNVVPVFGSFAVTLLVWWWVRESVFVDRHARASINFQLSMTVYYVLALGYVYVSVGFALLLLVSSAIFEAVSIVVATRKAKAGELYQYRMCMEFVRHRGSR